MIDDDSQQFFQRLNIGLLRKIFYFIILIALLKSISIVTKIHLKSLQELKSVFSFKNRVMISIQQNSLVFRHLNHLINSQGKANHALLNLCQLTAIDIIDDNNLGEILYKTQKSWLRHPTKERYELTTSDYEKDKEKFLLCFKSLGVLDTMHARHIHKPYDIVLLHGATSDKVMMRIQFLIREYQRGVRFNQVVLLSGDRPLHPIKEAEYIQLGLKTEAEMLQYLWKITPGLPESVVKNFYLVDTPGKKTNQTYQRPTTRDTIYQWLNEMPPAPKSQCLAISHQPFIPFQDFVLYNTLRDKGIDISFETIGIQASLKEPITVHLDNLTRCLYELLLSRK